MGNDSSKMAEEMAQLRNDIKPLVDLQTSHVRRAEEMAQLRDDKRAEEMAQLRMEMRAERRAQRDKERRAEEMAQLRMEMMAEEMAQLRMEMRAEEMAQLRMEMMAEREAQRDKERRAEEMAQRDKERMAEEMAQLRMEMRAEREAQRDKERMATGSVQSVDSGVSFKSDRSKTEPIVFKEGVSPRLGFVGCDVPAVKDFNKPLKNLMARRIAWLRKERMTKRRPESPDSGVSLKRDQSKEDVTNFKDSPKLVDSDVSGVEEFNKFWDNLMTLREAQLHVKTMTKRRPESSDSDVSLKSDQSKEDVPNFKDRDSPRLVDSDVSGVEEFNKFWDNLMLKRIAQRHKERRAEREAQRDKESELDFSAPVMRHVVADVGFFESLGDQEEMNQELSSEVG